MTARGAAILLMVVTGLVACSSGGGKPGPLLPDAPGSQVLSRGRHSVVGPVDIGVNAIADGKASLTMVPTGQGSGDRPAAVSVVLGRGQSAEVGTARVTVIAVDGEGKGGRVRVTVEEPTPTPSSPGMDTTPPTPPTTT